MNVFHHIRNTIHSKGKIGNLSTVLLVENPMKPLLFLLIFLPSVVAASCSSSESTETTDPGPSTTTTAGAGEASTTSAPDDTTTTTVVSTTSVVSDNGAPDCVGDDWVAVDAGPFGFWTPPDVRDEEVQGIDSLVGRYVGDGLEIMFDYGWYSPGIDELERFGATLTPIDLGDATGTYATADGTAADFGAEHVTHLRVDRIPGADPSNALWMGVNYDDAELTAAAECIVGSVRFA